MRSARFFALDTPFKYKVAQKGPLKEPQLQAFVLAWNALEIQCFHFPSYIGVPYYILNEEVIVFVWWKPHKKYFLGHEKIFNFIHKATEMVMDSVSGLPGYCCTFRGNILVKGKGALPTYWISKKINGI